MFQLGGALAALGRYRQFIVCKYIPSQKRPGKYDKIPINPLTGVLVDAHTPAHWLSCEEAAGYAEAWGAEYGVGFVFTAADPFFFLDIDSCLQDGEWAQHATALCARFPGAAIEISLSGRGLHIIACGTAPSHKTRDAGNTFELYTELRFCALTGNGAMGDAATTHTPALAAIVAEYLNPTAGETPHDWQAACAAGRHADWRGPEDDNALIERALRSTSAAAAFGGKASFADLWTANVNALATAFPDNERSYDASKADSALAQHLAFWTGKDHDRILRLMNLSQLKREKWEDRGDYYLPRTIMNVVVRQSDVYQEKPLVQVSAIPRPPMAAPAGKPIQGETFINPEDQINIFLGCVYVISRHRILVPGGHLMKPDQFRALYGGFSFVLDWNNSSVTHDAWECFTQSRCMKFPKVWDVVFRPDRDPAEITNEGGVDLVNIWWPVDTKRVKGDATPFLNLLAKMFPNDRDRGILIAYLAAVVQYPGIKFQWWPLIQGVEGGGKTMIGRAVSYAMGDRYTHIPNIDGIAEGMKFTGWVHQKLFILLEEVYSKEKGSLVDILKPLVTNERMEIQNKGVDQVTGDNRANGMGLSNHKGAVPKNTKDRRWCILFTAQQEPDDLIRGGMDGDYFPDLWDWFKGKGSREEGAAIINDYLHDYKIPDELNPATKLHRAPVTSSTAEAVQLSLGAIEQEILELVEQGTVGFAGGWISSTFLDSLLRQLRFDMKIPHRKRRELLQNLGYDWHPALVANFGRTDNPVLPDGKKSRLFVKMKSIPALNHHTASEVAKAYTEAQMAATKKLAESAKFGT